MPSPGRRIAVLCSADSYRGSAVSFEHLAHGLAAHGAAVRMFTGHESLTVPMRASGIDVEQFDLRSTNLRTALRLRASLRTFGAEVLMVDRPRDLRLGWLATVGTPVALVNRYNWFGPIPPHDLLTRLAYRVGVRTTIFLTQEMSARVLRLAPWMGRAPHRVIPEGIDLDQFRPDVVAAASFRVRHGLGTGPFVLVVGTLTPEKRTAKVIEAMRMVPNAPPLLICGEGPLRDELERHAQQAGVGIRLLGRLPRRELCGALSAASVVAHACAVETFGLGVLEAMACGAPVVGVSAGGLLEVVGDAGDAGLLVPPDDVAALGKAIARVLTDSELAERLRAGARARAEARFALGRMTAAYEEATRAVVR